MATQRDSFARAEAFALLGVGVLLIVAAILRQDFIGDGVRHVQPAIFSSHPLIGEPRWLLFPSLAWALIHPLAWMGLVTDVESAIRVLLVASVVSGIAYLLAIRAWLRAEAQDAGTRTAAMIFAASTMPFLVLYADIAEVQVAAAAVVVALALTRARTAAGKTRDGTVLTLVAVIAAAALVYQGLIIATAFVPLVVPFENIRRRKVLLGGAAILAAVPLLMIVARVTVGESTILALQMTVAGEANPLARSAIAVATPVKWAAAFVAGPPQAIIRLTDFRGLPVLVRDLRSDSTRGTAIADVARLAGGLILVWAIVYSMVRARDWRLALAMLAVVALPTVRNGQYTYHKFYVLWPVLMAIASTKFPARWVLIVGSLVLMLNGALLARDVAAGRRLHAEVEAAYRTASPGACFFTAGWSAPFPYLWPGTSTGIISDLWRGSAVSAAAHPLAASLAHCFCGSSRVWTETTQDERDTVERLLTQFKYTGPPVLDLLYRPGDGSQVMWNPRPMFIYSPDRQAELCRRLSNR